MIWNQKLFKKLYWFLASSSLSTIKTIHHDGLKKMLAWKLVLFFWLFPEKYVCDDSTQLSNQSNHVTCVDQHDLKNLITSNLIKFPLSLRLKIEEVWMEALRKKSSTKFLVIFLKIKYIFIPIDHDAHFCSNEFYC